MKPYAIRVKGWGLSFAERRKFLWILFLTGLALIAALAATATTLAPLKLEEMAQKATVVVRARCFRVSTERTGGELWTVSEFEVVKALKGQVGGIVSVRMPGGRGDGIVSHVDAVPAFSPGEEAYLFLWNREGEPHRVLGWTQGTFRVTRGEKGGAERVTQDSAGAAFDPESRRFRRTGIRKMRVADFEEKLRQALDGRAAGE